jgi:hypothetical protein
MTFNVITPRVITVTITADETGFISVETRGPIDGNRGLVQLLDAARVLAVQGIQKAPPGRTPRL